MVQLFDFTDKQILGNLGNLPNILWPELFPVTKIATVIYKYKIVIFKSH